MDRKLLFALLLLPGLAQAVICKTVGPDGVISFTNVPGSECPSGEAVETYVPPAATAERAERLVEGAAGSEAAFAGYESIRIESPEDGATVRNNEGRVPVTVALKPGLQQFHFITAYLDGKATQGPYGDSEVVLTNVDRGTHRLYVTVKDSRGRTLIKSDVITFTLQRVTSKLIVNPITGDDYVDNYDPDTVKILGCYECAKRKQDEGEDSDSSQYLPAWITLSFPTSDWVSLPVEVLANPETVERVIETRNGPKTVVETYNWVVEVPRELLESEASFEARAQLEPETNDPAPIEERLEKLPFESKTTSTHSVDPALFKAFFDGVAPGDYSPSPPADYRSKGAFTPKYTP